MIKEDTIAAVATPPGQGAVSLIRISGRDASSICQTVFCGKKSNSQSWQPRYQQFGSVIDPDSRQELDEVLLTYFPGPRSFTGEDVVEIACHGGIAVTESILRVLFQLGARPADPGEFSQRAFLNGKIDLTQAEAIMDLISARTELAARAATQQLQGRLGDQLEDLRQGLIALAAHLEAWIDFPEEDIDPDSQSTLLNRIDSLIQDVTRLLATADQGRFLREGIRTVIAGAPNAGKSSLLNLLLGFDRAIVNAQAGTTRDTVEEVINLGGLPLRLIDTAGIREGSDEIEREGIQRSQDQIEQSDLILYVIDTSASAELTRHIQIPDGKRVLKIFNKNDLSIHPDWSIKNPDNADSAALSVSCLSPDDAEKIMKAISEFILGKAGKFDSPNLVAINARHQNCLNQALHSLEQARSLLTSHDSTEFAAMDIREALNCVGEIIGKTDIEEILGEIFSTFCIGK